MKIYDKVKIAEAYGIPLAELTVDHFLYYQAIHGKGEKRTPSPLMDAMQSDLGKTIRALISGKDWGIDAEPNPSK